jgi:hypothetical protein
MMYMEITLLPKSSLKIKGKNASFVVDPKDSTLYSAAFLLEKESAVGSENEDMVVLDGPGEYEVGGVKMTGSRSEAGVNYSLSLDGVDIVFGKISSLEKMHTKLKEHNIVVALCDEVVSPSFLTALSSSALVLYGEKAAEVAQTFGEVVKKMPKYVTTKDKLPLEMETIVLE